MTTVQSYVMLVLHNGRMIPSNVRKKNKGTTKCNKNIATCDVNATQYEDGIIKCEKKEGNYLM